MIIVTIRMDETKIDKFGEVKFGLGGRITEVNNWNVTGFVRIIDPVCTQQFGAPGENEIAVEITRVMKRVEEKV